MNKIVHYIGLDVHKDSIAVAIAPQNSREVRRYGIIGGTLDAVDKLLKRLSQPNIELRLVYEAGPCGFVLCRHLRSKAIHCDLVCPSLIPKKASDRVKTDRRDADQLARLYRAGELTPLPASPSSSASGCAGKSAVKGLRVLVHSRVTSIVVVMRLSLTASSPLQKLICAPIRVHPPCSRTVAAGPWSVSALRFPLCALRFAPSRFQRFSVSAFSPHAPRTTHHALNPFRVFRLFRG